MHRPPAAAPSAPAPRDSRRAAGRSSAGLALAAAALLVAGCASDAPTRPTVERNGSFDRSEMVPSEVLEMREQLASQRSDTLDRMNAVRPESAEMETHGSSDPFGMALDAFGWAADRAADVMSLRAFGLW